METRASPTLKLAPLIHCSVMLVLAVLVIVANLYVISQAKKLHKRSVPKLLLVNQAIADLHIGLFYVPAVIIDYHVSVGILRYVTCLLLLNGLLARCIIAFDRYISIVKPLHHKIIMSLGRVKVILQVSFCFTILLDVIPLIWHRASAETSRRADVYFQVILCCLIAFSLLGLFLVYILTFKKTNQFFKSKISCINERQMWIVLRVSSAEKLYQSKQRRLTVRFAVMAASFIITYLPILYINFVGITSKRREYTPMVLIDVSSYLFILNALFTPIFSAYQQRTRMNPKAYEYPGLLSSPQQMHVERSLRTHQELKMSANLMGL